MALKYTSEPKRNADNILSVQVHPFVCLSGKKKVASPPGTHVANAVWVATCGGKHIASHTHKSEGLYMARFHSIDSHLGVLFSFFFHAVWVSFTAQTLKPWYTIRPFFLAHLQKASTNGAKAQEMCEKMLRGGKEKKMSSLSFRRVSLHCCQSGSHCG